MLPNLSAPSSPATQDEEPQCAYPAITAACEPKCKGPTAKYEACKERIAKNPELGDCEPWYFDYLKVITPAPAL